MKRILPALLLAPALVWAEPVKVIFDTDMLTDFDDVGALACLHALADAGEAEILGLAEWDTTKTHRFANRAIRFLRDPENPNLPKTAMVAFEQ